MCSFSCARLDGFPPHHQLLCLGYDQNPAAGSPIETNLATHAEVRRILEAHKGKTVRKVPACRHGCVAYVDLDFGPQALRGCADRDSCPVCTVKISPGPGMWRVSVPTPRYVVDPKTGKKLESHYIYVFELGWYFKSLFSRPDLAGHLDNSQAGPAVVHL